MNIAQRRGDENDQLQLQLIYTNYRARWCAFKSRTAIHRKRCFVERFSLFEENFRRSTVTVRRSEVFAVAFLQKAVARAGAVVLVDVSALCTCTHGDPSNAFPAVGLGWLQSALARQQRYKLPDPIFIRLIYAFFAASGKSPRSDLHFVAVAQASDEGNDEEVKFPCVSAYEAIMFSIALRVSTVALASLKWTFIRPTSSLSCFFCSSVRENQWFQFFFAPRCTKVHLQLLISCKTHRFRLVSRSD